MTQTSTALAVPAAPAVGRPVQGLGELAWRRFRRHRLAMAATVLLLLIVAISALAPLVRAEDAANRVNPLNTLARPSAEHPFGTDDVGRDILWRTIYGGRVSLAIGTLAVLIAMTV